MAKRQPSYEMHIDPKLKGFLNSASNGQLKEARERAVKAAGMVWADEAKGITRSDGHIITGLYINSIGYASGSPASASDVVNTLNSQQRGRTTLDIGSNVAYATALEERFSIMARALDQALPRMTKVAEEQVKRVLFG